MNKILLIFFLATTTLVGFTQSYETVKPYVIPTTDTTINPNLFDVYRVYASGPTDLGSHSFIMAFSATPKPAAHWEVQFDATNLTADTSKVTIFGVKPLSDFPYIKKYVIDFLVVNTGVVAYHYVGSPFIGGTVSNVTTTGTSNFGGDIKYQHAIGSPYDPVNNGLILESDTSIGVGCPACSWNVLLNAGTNPSTNGLGTSDSVDLAFKVNNFRSGLISAGLFNTTLGYRAGRLITTASNNTAIGSNALFTNTQTGSTAIGSRSLYFSGTGSNTAVGYFSGYNTTGSHNTYTGEGAGYSVTTGTNNVAFGYYAFGSTLTTGSNNTALGYAADVSSPGLSNAIALGSGATAVSNGQLALPDAVTLLYAKLNNNTQTGSVLRNDGAGNASWVSLIDDKEILVTFETGELGDNKFRMDFSGVITGEYAYAVKAIAATDTGTIVLKNNAGTTMGGSTIKFAPSDSRGTAYTATPTSNNTFVAGDVLNINTAKTTAGGKVLLTIQYTRTQ